MKNLILSFTLVAFIGSISFANSTFFNSTNINIELSDNGEDDEKCKKGCKKECCTKKEEKKECTKGEKKACCSKSKKSCTKSKATEAK